MEAAISPVQISPLNRGHLSSLLRLLRQSLPQEPITDTSFTRKVVLDPNFDASGALVAHDDAGEVLGFLLALTRRRPLEDGPDDTDRGWITLFAVADTARRQGTGTALFDRAEAWLWERGCATVSISPYAPNYWTPGVDEAAYPEALAFLQQRGYTTVSRPLSMDASLTGGWSVPDWGKERRAELSRQGIEVVKFYSRNALPLTDFLRREFPGDWQRYLRETMLDIVAGRRPPDELTLAWGVADRRPPGELTPAWERSTLIGFAQSEGERFGPFGVADAVRGRGVGAALLFHTLEGMQARGHHNAWFLWTDDKTADRLYRGAGFRETRRYAVMRKMLV
ncbi:MAG: GCN5-related N-acetyltransferase [Chthonomonadaceae bacterium]|nr:GCN5-related N-acetyltransferase [Chthonomonadaceae bacterium]